MKNFFLNIARCLFGILLLMMGSGLHAQNNMGIGTSMPDASAILEIKSNDKGLLIPRISSPPGGTATGLLFYNTTSKVFNYWDGVWRPVGLWSLNGTSAYYSAGNVGIGISNPLNTLAVISSDPSILVGSSSGNLGAVYFGNSAHGVKRNYSGINDVGLYTTSANIYLSANGTSTSQFVLKNNGNVGIGTSTPFNKLDVEGGMAVGGAYSGSENAPSNGAIIEGKVGIGTNTVGSYQLAVKHSSFGLQIQSTQSGTASWELWQNSPSNFDLQLYTTGVSSPVGSFNYTSGVYSASSDRRLKDNINPLNNVLPSLMQLEAKNYTYKSDPKKAINIGFIAQDVEKLFPEFVVPPSISERGESYYLMNYAGFGIIAVKAIQEQQQIIESQNEKIETLEEEIKTQQAKIDNIEKALMKAGIKLD